MVKEKLDTGELPGETRGDRLDLLPLFERTPAMAAGLTDHIWCLWELLLYRVPPWPQAATKA